MKLKVHDGSFIDEKGRTVLLRGVNLSGSSKVPFKPNGATHIKTDFRDNENVSFVGRPLPLKEAPEHFHRLKQWGFNSLRVLITWEAIEHEGPKKYDTEYLDYLEELIKLAVDNDFFIYIDPHQDVWSRMTGGDGAPGWTFEKVGLDYTKFNASEAACVMQYRYDPEDPSKFLPLYWAGNHYRLACGTMWTLFFGSKDFAPSSKINGNATQDYLQGHFFEAMKQVALRVKDYPEVLGFDILNEAPEGLIEKYVDGSEWEGKSEVLGHVFTPFDAMLTGAGYTRILGFQEMKRFGIKETRKDELNGNKVSCWLEGARDIWREEGVWGLDNDNNPIILNNEYFVFKDGKKIEFYKDYFSPFFKNYSEAIRKVFPNAIIFFTGPSEKILKGGELDIKIPENSVHAAHWYDVATVGTKKAMLKANYNLITGKPVVGKGNVKKMFKSQLESVKKYANTYLGGIPTIIGEFGLAYDINNKEAYVKFKNDPEEAWNTHVEALTMYYNALDANLLHSNQWNYTPDNTNEWGDMWNLEDFSMFSVDQLIDSSDIHSGGRAIKGFCRPRFIYCTGKPLEMSFKLKEGIFTFNFDGDSSIADYTIIYIPKIQYPNGYNVEVSEGEIIKKDEEQLLFLKINENGPHSIQITRI